MFGVVGFFLLIVGVVYGWLTATFEPGIEWVGFPAFLALGAMSLMVSVILWMNDRRFGTGASDRDDAEVHEEAGIQGTFAPHSWAPLWTSLGCSFAFAGIPISWWMVAGGVALAMYGAISWAFEFSRGHHAH